MSPLKLSATCALAVISLAALAGVTVNRTPADADHAACVARAMTEVGEMPIECAQRVVVAGHCEDIPEPAPVVEDGFAVQPPLEHAVCPNGTSYAFTQASPVRSPYPVCWRLAPREVHGCDPVETVLEIDPDGPWLPEIPDGMDLSIEAPHGGL
jgi:hypothetical protein